MFVCSAREFRCCLLPIWTSNWSLLFQSSRNDHKYFIRNACPTEFYVQQIFCGCAPNSWVGIYSVPCTQVAWIVLHIHQIRGIVFYSEPKQLTTNNNDHNESPTWILCSSVVMENNFQSEIIDKLTNDQQINSVAKRIDCCLNMI